MTRTAIYPGSFDPMTLGHIDIAQRGLKLFDRLIVAIAVNRNKSHMFSLDERLEMARACIGHLPGVEIDVYDELLVHYCRRKGVNVLLRGLRAVSDFEYEFQLASMNRKLAGDIETVFMMTSEEHFYLSSNLVREIASYGGDVSELVPEPVLKALKKKLG
jgi:pantetheine-phosphate adenylyltransferase